MAPELLSCSWPRPVEQADRRWVSDPDWGAPLMAQLPPAHTRTIDGQQCWALNWCQIFSHGLRFHSPRPSGEMRGFHVVFKLRIEDSGKLVFWDDDGSIIRRNGEVVHEDRECHPLTRHELPVRAGDCLEVAQWQYHGDWVWAARIEPVAGAAANIAVNTDIFEEHLPLVQKALRKPNGPPLKMYIAASAPARSMLCLYSMILNGYRPSSVHIFGEYQWNETAREIFARLLPFARIVATSEVREQIAAIQPELADLALRSWSVMKICAGLLSPPHDYCLMDDDIFILDSVSDAIAEFQTCDLVYAPDADYADSYRSIWRLNRDAHPLPTSNMNTGLYWLRNKHDPREIAERLLTSARISAPSWLWEQGFMAVEYARDSVCALPPQRYFYPYFDGLPGSIAGYDYATNPCGFASVHFGGLAEKPSDALSRMLAAQVLKRRTNGRAR
jgi:hypothetical protein